MEGKGGGGRRGGRSFVGLSNLWITVNPSGRASPNPSLLPLHALLSGGGLSCLPVVSRNSKISCYCMENGDGINLRCCSLSSHNPPKYMDYDHNLASTTLLMMTRLMVLAWWQRTRKRGASARGEGLQRSTKDYKEGGRRRGDGC